MSNLDEAIQGALSKEDAEFLAQIEEEPGAIQQMFGVFRGPFAWMTILFIVILVPLSVFAIYAGWKFAVLEDVRSMLHWGSIALVFLLVAITIRIWLFLEIQTNRVLRELKRVELQLARMTASQSGQADSIGGGVA